MSKFNSGMVAVKTAKGEVVNVEIWNVNNDVNGNPRFVIHYLDLAKLLNVSSYDEVKNLAKGSIFSKYRAKWFGGGFVFQSYNVEDDLSLASEKWALKTL